MNDRLNEYAAPTVKAEQVQCSTCNDTALIGDLPIECPDCCHDEAPSLPAAGSSDLTAVRCQCCATEYPHDSYDAGFIAGSGMCQVCDAAMPPKDLPAAGSVELEEAAGILRNMIDSINVHGNYSKESTLLFLNQALSSIVAALSAQQSAPERVSVPDTARLNFMLQKNRKVICERLPHDNFEVYVEEGFMGDKRHPGVRYSGKWENGSHEALEIKREAIDRALLNGGEA